MSFPLAERLQQYADGLERSREIQVAQPHLENEMLARPYYLELREQFLAATEVWIEDGHKVIPLGKIMVLPTRDDGTKFELGVTPPRNLDEVWANWAAADLSTLGYTVGLVHHSRGLYQMTASFEPGSAS